MKIFVIAGEPSGDRLGGALLAGLHRLVPNLEIEGVGGPQMAKQGLTSRFPMDELSVMGIAEVLPKYRHLKRRIAEVAEAVVAMKPDVLITIDSPDFCLRVARKVKAESSIRIVHYVAPTVWAWRAGRAAKMVGKVDQVLALFPFEPPYMEAVGIRCDFVGHPVAAEPVASDAEVRAFRHRYALGNAPVVLMLPGSRRSEVSRMAPIFGAALRPIMGAHPQARVVLPGAASVAPMLRDLTADWPVPPLILDPRGADPEVFAADKRASFRTAQGALAASGTVSLELAASGTPMVIAYDMNWLSRQIIGRMLKVDTVTLVNLVTRTRAVPEFIGAACRSDAIARSMLDVLRDPSAQMDAMALCMTLLGKEQEEPGLRAARAVLSGLGKP